MAELELTDEETELVVLCSWARLTCLYGCRAVDGEQTDKFVEMTRVILERIAESHDLDPALFVHAVDVGGVDANQGTPGGEHDPQR